MSNEILQVSDQDFVGSVVELRASGSGRLLGRLVRPLPHRRPVVEEIAIEQAGRLRVAKLNVDQNPRTTQRYGIQSIPTLILFSGGEEKGRVIGAQGKDAISQALLRDVAA